VLNLLPNMILTLGEELGWRWLPGAGAHEVDQLPAGERVQRRDLGSVAPTGDPAGAYGAVGTPKSYQLTCFTVMVIASAVVQAWLRMRSGSVWPSTIMHATHNGIIQAFFNRITVDTEPTPWFIGEFGVALVPFTVAVAWYCWRHAPT
jgi:hypothetical protein